jgi:two-component system, NarL family, invasion response regulator UvrY
MYRVLIVDDHPIFRAGLRQTLGETTDLLVTGEAGDADETLAQLPGASFDLIVLDLSLPGRSGLDLLRDLRQLAPAVPVLVLDTHESDEHVVRALRAGASGYLTKDRATTELVRALRLVLRGETYVSRRVVERLVNELRQDPERPPHEALSERELEVLRLLASGKAVKEVAATLSLSKSSVSTYRDRVLNKLGLRGNADLIRYAVEHGLLDD